MSIFKDKILLITGGTGSFGNAVLKRFWIAMSVKYAYLAVMRKNKTICGIDYRTRRLSFISVTCGINVVWIAL